MTMTAEPEKCAGCGEPISGDRWGIENKSYCHPCGKALLDRMAIDGWEDRRKQAHHDALIIATHLDRTVYIIEACPDRPLPHVFKKHAFVLDRPESFGAMGIRPDGSLEKVERR